MNKNEVIAKVAATAGLTKSDAQKAIDGFCSTIAGALKKKESVRLVGFGTFSVTKRKATTGRNPRTGAPIQIPAKDLPKFKAGKVLKQSVA